MTSLYRDKYRVESTRLKGWDYAADGWYFVTICTRGRECFFGKIVDQRMRLSKIGDIALRFWEDIPNHSVNAGLDAFVIMPNHLHGIITIKAPDGSTITGKNGGPGTHSHGCRDVACNVSTTDESGRLTDPPKPGSLGAIVRSYKSAVTRWCRMNGYTSFAWQPRFYDHVIRDGVALQNVRRYILDNPAKWGLDGNNPAGRWRRWERRGSSIRRGW
jgi:putative transposase